MESVGLTPHYFTPVFQRGIGISFETLTSQLDSKFVTQVSLLTYSQTRADPTPTERVGAG